MVNSHSTLLRDLATAVERDPFWAEYLRPLLENTHAPFALHLAVFIEPYLRHVLEGRKTVESRFSIHRCAPYGHVHRGDVLLLKKSGGPVIGLCLVSDAWFYRLDPESWREIKEEYAQALCAQDPGFWKQRERASFATLMRMQHPQIIPAVRLPKRDRRGWVVLLSPASPPGTLADATSGAREVVQDS